MCLIMTSKIQDYMDLLLQVTDKKTEIKKGIFTSCSQDQKCPAWSNTLKITHDKVKRDMIYENAILKIYDTSIIFSKIFSP